MGRLGWEAAVGHLPFSCLHGQGSPGCPRPARGTCPHTNLPELHQTMARPYQKDSYLFDGLSCLVQSRSSHGSVRPHLDRPWSGLSLQLPIAVAIHPLDCCGGGRACRCLPPCILRVARSHGSAGVASREHVIAP